MRRPNEIASDLMRKPGFWVLLFGAAIISILLWLLILQQGQNHQAQVTARDEATNAAVIQAGNISQLTQCYVGIKNAPIAHGFLEGQYAMLHNSILATTAALAVDPNGPLSKERKASLARLERAVDNLDKLKKIIDATTPTLKRCRALAKSLGVPYKKYENKILRKNLP